jgi:hypothetical protein
VGGFGVGTGQHGQPGDGILVDPHQPSRLANAAPVGEMLQDREHFVMRELGVEQWSPFELGEPSLASVAVEQPVVGPAEVAANREIARTALTGKRAVAILAAKAVEVVRGHETSWADPCGWFRSWMASIIIRKTLFNLHRTPPENRALENRNLASHDYAN